MVRKYGGKNYENKKANKPGNNKAGKNDRDSTGKAGASANNAEKK